MTSSFDTDTIDPLMIKAEILRGADATRGRAFAVARIETGSRTEARRETKGEAMTRPTHSHPGGMAECRSIYETRNPVFTCPECGKRRGWCQGSDDEGCDICLAKKERRSSVVRESLFGVVPAFAVVLEQCATGQLYVRRATLRDDARLAVHDGGIGRSEMPQWLGAVICAGVAMPDGIEVKR